MCSFTYLDIKKARFLNELATCAYFVSRGAKPVCSIETERHIFLSCLDEVEGIFERYNILYVESFQKAIDIADPNIYNKLSDEEIKKFYMDEEGKPLVWLCLSIFMYPHLEYVKKWIEKCYHKKEGPVGQTFPIKEWDVFREWMLGHFYGYSEEEIKNHLERNKII